MPDARALLNQMIEDNRVALVEARDKLDRLQMAQEDNNESTADQEGLEIMIQKYKNKR